MKGRLDIWIPAALGLALSACGGGGGGAPDDLGGPNPSPSPSPTETPTPTPTDTPTLLLNNRNVLPSQTADGLSNAYGVHRVYWPRLLTRPNGAVIFMPGSGTTPSDYVTLVESAAQMGQVVISLAYVNDRAINDLCTDFTTSCHGDLRAEIIYGEDRSPLVEVSPAESVQGRLSALLDHLEAEVPLVQWGDLQLADGTPDWSLMTLTGHSQGAGHAAYIAQQQPVFRVVMLSATEPAFWTAPNDITPREAFYGFTHLQDPGYAGISLSWRFLGIPGEPAEVDNVLPQVPDSQRLYTARDECNGFRTPQAYHGCTSVDVFLPSDALNRPVFLPLWRVWYAPR